MVEKLKSVIAFLKEGLWQVDVDALGFLKRVGVNLLRFISATMKSFTGHPTGLHAAGLTYFTILGFVPVLCLLMVCAKMCGVDHLARDKINEQIDAFIVQIEEGQEKAADAAAAAPREETEAAQAATDKKVMAEDLKAETKKDLARQVRTFSNETFDRIAKVDLSTLGWIGFAMLLWTVVSTLGQVESSFNEVWSVGKGRPIWLRFPLYLFVVVVLPIMATLALSMPIIHMVKSVLDATLGATSYTKWVGDALVAASLAVMAMGVVFATVVAEKVMSSFAETPADAGEPAVAPVESETPQSAPIQFHYRQRIRAPIPVRRIHTVGIRGNCRCYFNKHTHNTNRRGTCV